MDLDPDAYEPVHQAYLEYLDERFDNAPTEKRSRRAQFELGSPVPTDEAKIKAAEDKYLQSVRGGNTELNATNEARQALFGQHYREQIKEKEVDPTLYASNPDFRARANVEIEEKVAQKWQERQEQLEAGNRQGPGMSPQPESQQQEEIDWKRYTQDKGYQRQVNELVTKPQAQQKQNPRKR
jgi:hypothetical protein